MSNDLGVTQIGSTVPNQLFAGDFPRDAGEVQLMHGMVYKQGSCLGKITSSGLYTLVNSTATDGSNTVKCVLAEDVDATDQLNNAYGVGYFTGQFIAQKMIFGGTDTWQTHYDSARANAPIIFKPGDSEFDR
jgi:hypothetical protein